MDKPKKNACGCFSFLRKRDKKNIDRSLIIEDIRRREPEEGIQERGKDLNSSVDHSLVTTQKLFSPGNILRSTIMAPSCRTPQMHNLPRSTIMNFNDKCENTTARFVMTQESKPKTINHQSFLTSSIESQREKPYDREIKQTILFRDGEEKKVMIGGKAGDIIEGRLSLNNPRSSQEFIVNRKEIPGLVGHPEKVIGSQRLKLDQMEILGDFKEKDKIDDHLKLLNNSKQEEEKIKAGRINEFKGDEPIISPGMEALDKSNLNKHLPLLEISPIKSIMSVDDYTDIVNALTHPPQKQIIPDFFIRNKILSRPLPLLKPSTPRYLGKQLLLPKLRKDNQLLLENLIFK